jgi:Bcr/CflA subfamily drug resistance transporter
MKDNRYLIIGIVCTLAVLSVISTDFYVPAMPDMVGVLMSTPSAIKFSVTIYMFGLALSPLVFGPISDRYGRRPILLLCAGFGLAGSLLCWSAQSVQILILGRLLQGIGLGGGLSLARTVGSDLFDKNEFAQVASVISLCTSIGPAIAPVIGGYLHAHFGWRSIFLFVTGLITISTLAIIKKVPETIEKCNPQALQVKDMLSNYHELLVSKLFICNAILSGLTISPLILFAVMSTFIFQDGYHLSAIQYSWIMMLVTTALFLSRAANVIMLRTKTPEQCIAIGLSIMLAAASVGVLMSMLNMHYIFSVILPGMLMIFGSGIVPSNTAAIALVPFRHKGGSAGALYGFISMAGVFVASFIGSILPANNLVLAMIFLGISLMGIVMLRILSLPTLAIVAKELPR